MQNPSPTRQTWSSSLTYILTVAGATIGFGATWRFPYLVGECACLYFGDDFCWNPCDFSRKCHR